MTNDPFRRLPEVLSFTLTSPDFADGATPALLGFILRDHLIGRAVLTGLQGTE